MEAWEFSGGPVVRTRCFHRGGTGSIPGWGTKSSKPLGAAKKKEWTSIFTSGSTTNSCYNFGHMTRASLNFFVYILECRADTPQCPSNSKAL